MGSTSRANRYWPARGINCSGKSRFHVMSYRNFCKTRMTLAPTEATAVINNDELVFSHNGEDFNEEQFASLCRFGFSNKRMLHTIGFRGVGFKSTFSLGDEVHLVTPTLSVAFRKQRFTEPVWMESPGTVEGRTEIRVVLQSQRVQRELGKSLQEWIESPASLLFFSSVRCLRLDESGNPVGSLKGPAP